MSISIYQLLGDISLAASFLVLAYQMGIKHDANGISRKTQELYLTAFLLRYMDIFGTFHQHVYNTFFKLFYVTLSSWMVSLLRFPIGQLRYTTISDQDGCNQWLFVLLPSLILTILTEAVAPLQNFLFVEFFFTFSLFLESMVLIPQLFIMHFQRNKVWATDVYVFLVGLYRCLHMANWILRSPFNNSHQRIFVVYICGFIQLGIIIGAWMIRRCKNEKGQMGAGGELLQNNNSIYNLLEDIDEENSENRALIPSFMLDEEGEPMVHSSQRGNVRRV